MMNKRLNNFPEDDFELDDFELDIDYEDDDDDYTIPYESAMEP